MNNSQHKYGSDLIIEVLKQYDIQYVAFNPGASFRGLHDSIVHQNCLPTLQPIMCCHEEISVAIAHGYAKASGKFMAVFVHANIGLQHASMAIFNAWCDRVPILIIGGVGPADLTKRRPWIDWIHYSHNQDLIIKDFVKWSYQPYNLASVPDSLYRACKILNSEPKAPVYIAIDSEIQECQWNEDLQLKNVKQFLPSTPPAIEITSLDTLAKILMNATFPLIIVDFTGRNPSSVKSLIHLAEMISIGIIDLGGRYNFPSNHPLNLTGIKKEVYENIDVILALDVLDLYGALGEFDNGTYKSYISADAKIINISLAEFLISNGSADYQKLYPTDIAIAADSSYALSQLNVICESQLTPDKVKRYQDRANKIHKLHNSLKNEWYSITQSMYNKKPLPTPAVILKIGETIQNYDWVLTNYGSIETAKWIRRFWNLDRIGCYLGGSGGAGLGYGLGASIGAALAHKNTDKVCIDIQSDGDFLFTPSALWTAAHYQIPLLIIVMNNHSYKNSEDHAIKIANDRNRYNYDAQIATSLAEPNINFSKLAKSFGIHATKPIVDLTQIKRTLQQAIKYMKKEMKPVLIDIVIE